jgi:hypothetical protein
MYEAYDRDKAGYMLQLAANMVRDAVTVDLDQLIEHGYSSVKLDDTLRIFGWYLSFNVLNRLGFAEPIK